MGGCGSGRCKQCKNVCRPGSKMTCRTCKKKPGCGSGRCKQCRNICRPSGLGEDTDLNKSEDQIESSDLSTSEDGDYKESVFGSEEVGAGSIEGGNRCRSCKKKPGCSAGRCKQCKNVCRPGSKMTCRTCKKKPGCGSGRCKQCRKVCRPSGLGEDTDLNKSEDHIESSDLSTSEDGDYKESVFGSEEVGAGSEAILLQK